MAKPRPKRPPGYKSTIVRFRELLADGRPHSVEELCALLWDEAGGKRNLSPYLAALRREYATEGLVLALIRNGRTWYQMTKPLSVPDAISPPTPQSVT